MTRKKRRTRTRQQRKAIQRKLARAFVGYFRIPRRFFKPVTFAPWVMDMIRHGVRFVFVAKDPE